MLVNFNVWDGQCVYYLHIQNSILGSSFTILSMILGSLKLSGTDARFPVPLHYERQCAQPLSSVSIPISEAQGISGRRDGKSIRLAG